MSKIAEIKNGDQARTFDLMRESDALYLSVKCSDNRGHSKILQIKVSDVLYQIWKYMTLREKRDVIKTVQNLIATDQKIA